MTLAPDFSIIRAMKAPALFAPWYSGASWDGWKAVLKAAYCLPMTEAEIGFFRSVAERDPPSRRVKELWLICGRGAGKDSIASAIIAHTAALFDPAGKLRPGERAAIVCVAVDRDQAGIIKGYCKAFFDHIEPLRSMVIRETQDGLALNNAVDISIFTNSHRSIRGRSVLVAVMDECGFWRDETSSVPDQEVYRALRPALARVPGSMLIGISSPYKRSGLLYEKFSKHYAVNDDDILVIRAPSKTLNPTLDDAEIARDMRDDPAAARTEWFAEWRSDIASWLELEVIEAARDTGVVARPPRPGVRYYSGADPSGGAKDSFTLAIAHAEGPQQILDALVEIKPPFNPQDATQQMADTLRQYGLHHTTGDKYAAQWVVSAFQKAGIRYAHSERDRSQIYLDTLPLFTSGCVRLLDSDKLITQYAGLERRTSSIGKDRVDHGRNGHDDLCNAASLALVLAAQRKGPMQISDSLLAKSRMPARPIPVSFT